VYLGSLYLINHGLLGGLIPSFFLNCHHSYPLRLQKTTLLKTYQILHGRHAISISVINLRTGKCEIHMLQHSRQLLNVPTHPPPPPCNTFIPLVPGRAFKYRIRNKSVYPSLSDFEPPQFQECLGRQYGARA